jgi:hypothetical protein
MDELKKTGPNLIKVKKENPFEVPDRYFEDFSARLSDKIHADRKPSSQSKYVLALRPYLAAAVILIVMLLAGNYFFSNYQSRRAEKRFHAEITQVVEQELYSISEETILEVFEVEVPEESVSTTVSSEDAINYLMHENVNEEELINAL